MARRLTGPEVLTRAEVARVLEVHPSTVTRWATAGLLPYFRTPAGERRYHRREVQDFLNKPSPAHLAPYYTGQGSQFAQGGPGCPSRTSSIATSEEDRGCCRAHHATVAESTQMTAR